jgi:hypothetical protein
MSQMLEAFQRSVQQCLADSASAKLAGRSDLGLLMATEPDAELLDDAMSFYVPRSYEGFDGGSFIGALKAAGEVLQQRCSGEIEITDCVQNPTQCLSQ